MPIPFHTLIAGRQLLRRRLRLAVGVAGVAAAIVLAGVQLGLRNALYESAVRLHRSLDADVVIAHRAFVSLTNMPRFSDRYLYQAAAVEGVASVAALYADAVPWRNRETGVPRLINVYAFAAGTAPFLMPEVSRQAHLLADPEAVLFDRESRAEFGPVVADWTAGRSTVYGLSLDQRFPGDRTVRVVGLFGLGPSFVVDGDIITSDRGFQRMTGVSLDRITFALVRARAGEQPERLAQRLAAALDDRVRVMTKPALIALEKRYWARSTAIGFIFDLGFLMGCLVGATFVYQVLFVVVQEHVHEYAVLKSVGHGPRFLRSIVLQSAWMVGAAALALGLPAAAGLLWICKAATGLPTGIDLEAAIALPVAALAMSTVAGLMAARGVGRADIADLLS